MTGTRVHIMASITSARPPVLPPRPNWQDRAACRETWDPVFFDVNDEPAQAQTAAEKYCNTCPVRITCMATALKTKSPGVWAGTTTDQRKALIRTRTRTKCPVCHGETLIPDGRHDMCAACGVSWRTERRTDETERDTTDGDDDR